MGGGWPHLHLTQGFYAEKPDLLELVFGTSNRQLSFADFCGSEDDYRREGSDRELEW